VADDTNLERDRFQLEQEKLAFEIRKFEAEAPKRAAELAKLDAEKQKTTLEADDLRIPFKERPAYRLRNSKCSPRQPQSYL
jgi:hypothetical protein